VDTVDEALAHLGCTAAVVTVDPHTLEDVRGSVTTLGAATGHDDAARALVAGLWTRLLDVATAVSGLPAPRTVLLEWTDPPFAPGHWVPEMVERAGGLPVLGRAGQKSVRTTWEAVADARPEVVVCAPCGYDLDGATRQAIALVERDVLPSGVPVWAVDADAAYARPGPRLADGVETLAAILHPEVMGPPKEARRVR
jgi:iron complex transport system substrate-binding protein